MFELPKTETDLSFKNLRKGGKWIRGKHVQKSKNKKPKTVNV